LGAKGFAAVRAKEDGAPLAIVNPDGKLDDRLPTVGTERLCVQDIQ
jgi:hypothetical protein